MNNKEAMLKVMILANDTTYTYNLRNEIIERIAAEGYDVLIAAQPLLCREELVRLGARLINIETKRHGTNPISDLILLQHYIKILRDEKPDIVLSYNIKPNVYGGMACRITKTPYLPNITGLGTAVEYEGLMQKLTIRLYRAGVAGATCVFFQNEENRKFFGDNKMLRPECRTVLLPGSGVSLKVHKAMEYAADGDSINFLFIARIMKEKGIDLYLNAAERIRKTHKNTAFHVCGYCDDGKYKTLLEEREKDGTIIYHGEQKDMIPFFEKSHCIVHPSYYPEGMSNVLLEAAAHCRPIIATDRAGCRETVEDGITGFLIPIKDEDSLVDALEKFLKMSWEQRRQMGLAGRAKIEREFDRQIVADKYLEEIKRVLASTG